jgi:hypothetical protein
VSSQPGLPDSARRRVGSCSKRLRNNRSTYARALAIELAPIVSTRYLLACYAQTSGKT